MHDMISDEKEVIVAKMATKERWLGLRERRENKGLRFRVEGDRKL